MTSPATHTPEYQAQMEAFAKTFEATTHYCLRCKSPQTMKQVSLQWSKNNVPTAKGHCDTCGAGMNRTLPRQPTT